MFIVVFVTSKSNSCTQTSAIMDPEPTVEHTYATMFNGDSSGGKFICSSSVDAVQEYAPGDTCTEFPSDANPSGWLGKNGVCEVDTGRCAPGTDCTDCPTDPMCEPGRDGMSLGTGDTCACRQDDFCCSHWDVSCGLCELGFDTRQDVGRSWGQEDGSGRLFCSSTHCTSAEDVLALLDTVPSSSLAETIRYHHVQHDWDSGGPRYSFVGMRVGKCVANSCSDPAALTRVEQLSRNIREDMKLRLSVLHEAHLSGRAYDAHGSEFEYADPSEAPTQLNSLVDVVQRDEERFSTLSGPLVVPGSLEQLALPYLGMDAAALVDFFSPPLNLNFEAGCTVGGTVGGAEGELEAPFLRTTVGPDAIFGAKLVPLESRLPGCGLSADVSDMSQVLGYLETMLGPEMSVHSESAACSRFETMHPDIPRICFVPDYGNTAAICAEGYDAYDTANAEFIASLQELTTVERCSTLRFLGSELNRECVWTDADSIADAAICGLASEDDCPDAAGGDGDRACTYRAKTDADCSFMGGSCPGTCAATYTCSSPSRDSPGRLLPNWGATACKSGIEPTACDRTCQQQHCSVAEGPGIDTHAACEILPGCTFSPGYCTLSGYMYVQTRYSVGGQGYAIYSEETCEAACEAAGNCPLGGQTWHVATCNPSDPSNSLALDDQFWARGPAQAKIDQCAAFHRLQYDSCYQPRETCVIEDNPGDCNGEGPGFADMYDGCTAKPNCVVTEPKPLYRDGVCQVNSGLCNAGTDCSDCPSDTACPGVGIERFTPCRLLGIECDQYVKQQFGADHELVQQCGLPEDLDTCAEVECPAGSVQSVIASVTYIDCPDVSIELGAAMGYLFIVEVSATAAIVILVVVASGGTFKSAWDQARSVIRTEMATEDAEAQALLEEHRTLGVPTPAGEAA